MSDSAEPPHRPRKHAPSRAEFDATVADIEAQVRATNEKINERSGRPLLMAILVGVALGGGLLLSLLLVKELFMVYGLLLVTFTSWELASALRFAGRDVPRVPTVIAAAAIVPAAFYLPTGHWLAFLAGVAFVSLWRIVEHAVSRSRLSTNELIKDLGAGAFVQSYVVFLAGFAVLLTTQEGGEWWTLAYLIIVVSVDVGAYATGINFGKHPMAPAISPKKTWEGFAGSALAAVIAGVLLAIFMLGQPWWVGIIMGVVLTIVGTGGDLAESLIKRDLGIKDMSRVIPGHGGLMDRLDSLLATIAPIWLLLHYLVFA